MAKYPIDELHKIVEWTFNLANCSPQQAQGYQFDDIPSTIKGINKWEKIANAKVLKYLIGNNKTFVSESLNLTNYEHAFILFFYDGKTGTKYASLVNAIMDYLNYDKLPREAQYFVIHYELFKKGNINALVEQMTKIPATTNKHYTQELSSKIKDIRNTILCKIAVLFDVEIEEKQEDIKPAINKVQKKSNINLTASGK